MAEIPPPISEDIATLLEMGILGNCKTVSSEYIAWPVLKPDELPDSFRDQYNRFNEVRVLRR